MSAPVSVSVERAKQIMATEISCTCGCSVNAQELRAAANTIISQAQAIMLDEARIAELEKSFAESERQRRLAIDMVAIALKVEVL